MEYAEYVLPILVILIILYLLKVTFKIAITIAIVTGIVTYLLPIPEQYTMCTIAGFSVLLLSGKIKKLHWRVMLAGLSAGLIYVLA